MTEVGWRQRFGDRLIDAIRRAGLNQRTFAAKLGITEGAVSRWVNGHTDPELSLLPKVARALGVTLDWLLGVPDEPPPRPLSGLLSPAERKRRARAMRDLADALERVAPYLKDDDE